MMTGFVNKIPKVLNISLEGFGAHSKVHTAKILRLSSDLPIIIEMLIPTKK